MTTTWILLRGLTRACHHWGRFAGVLEHTLGDVRVIALELPGNGSLHRMSSPASIPAMAAYCRTALVQRGIAPPYRILAMSLGAMVAVAWASAHPAEVSHCVLVNTSLRPFSPFYRRLRPANYPALLRVALGARALAAERAILRMTSAIHADDATLAQDWATFRALHPVSAGNALCQVLAAACFRAPLVPPLADTLLLAGAGDQLVSPECSRAIATAWRRELRVHPTAGHDLPLDDGPWVAAQVADWLAGRRNGRLSDGSTPGDKV